MKKKEKDSTRIGEHKPVHTVILNTEKQTDWNFQVNVCLKKKQEKGKYCWPRRDSNTQPSDLESDALPLRHGVNRHTTVEN